MPRGNRRPRNTRMIKNFSRQRVFPKIDFNSIETLNNLIPPRISDSPTARSDKIAKAVLQKVFGSDWMSKHVETRRGGFLSGDGTDPLPRETKRMRRITLAEMLYNTEREGI